MKTFIILIQLIGGLTLIPWFVAAGQSFLIFESPRSIKKITPWLFIFAVFVYPFILAICFWEAWNCINEGEQYDPFFWAALPTFIFVLSYLSITRFTDIHKKLSR